MIHGDVSVALMLYFIFAVVCTASGYLIAARFHSRRLGVLVALGVLFFFVLLMLGLLLLIRSV